LSVAFDSISLLSQILGPNLTPNFGFPDKISLPTRGELSNAADKVRDGWWANCRAIVLECGNLPPFAIGHDTPMIEQELLFHLPAGEVGRSLAHVNT
jgi:hypothetical protein